MTNILLLGDPGVGKSTWLRRLKGQSFSNTYCTTIGKDTYIFYTQNNRRVIFHDMGGQERYARATDTYYDIADGALIFYDIGNKASKDRLKYWKNKLNKQIPTIIVANKKDVSKHKPTSLQRNTTYWISCKSDNDIKRPLLDLLQRITPLDETTFLKQILDTFFQYYCYYYRRLLT